MNDFALWYYAGNNEVHIRFISALSLFQAFEKFRKQLKGVHVFRIESVHETIKYLDSQDEYNIIWDLNFNDYVEVS